MTNENGTALYEQLNSAAAGIRRTHEVEDAIHDAWIEIRANSDSSLRPETVFRRALRRTRSRKLGVRELEHVER